MFIRRLFQYFLVFLLLQVSILQKTVQPVEVCEKNESSALRAGTNCIFRNSY